tara:strand:+ start:90 stop:314 length:225 start_codon:yes stop_codon:yes gene_type:complete
MMEEELSRTIVGDEIYITYRKIDSSNPVEDFETIETRCYPIPKEEKKDVIVPFKRTKDKKTITGILFFAHEVEV